MKSKERQRLLKIHGSKYKVHRHETIYRNVCFYCSEPADTVDHCPPINAVEEYSKEYWKREQIPFVTVWSCRNCNSVLGSKLLFSLYERTQYIEDKLLNKYDKAHTLWTDEEIKELGYSLQTSVKASIEKSKVLLHRARKAQERLLEYDSFPKWEE